jgi:hypothetical protein
VANRHVSVGENERLTVLRKIVLSFVRPQRLFDGVQYETSLRPAFWYVRYSLRSNGGYKSSSGMVMTRPSPIGIGAASQLEPAIGSWSGCPIGR